MAKLSDAKIKDLGRLADYLARDPENVVPQSRLEELKRLEKTPLRDLKSEEIETIVESIQHLMHLNKLKNKLIVKGKIRTHREIVEQAKVNLRKQHEKLDGSVSGLDSFEVDPGAGPMKKALVMFWNAELKCEILDGEVDGIIKEVVYHGIDRGIDNKIIYRFEAQDFFAERLKGIDIMDWSAAFNVKKADIGQVEIKISGNRTLKMTKGERVSFYLLSLNDKSLKHLEEGGISFANTPSKIVKLTPDDVSDVIRSLTPGELKVANAVHEYLNTIQKDKINEVSVRLNGTETATEENYFRIRTNYLDRYHEDLLKGEMGMSAQGYA